MAVDCMTLAAVVSTPLCRARYPELSLCPCGELFVVFTSKLQAALRSSHGRPWLRQPPPPPGRHLLPPSARPRGVLPAGATSLAAACQPRPQARSEGSHSDSAQGGTALPGGTIPPTGTVSPARTSLARNGSGRSDERTRLRGQRRPHEASPGVRQGGQQLDTGAAPAVRSEGQGLDGAATGVAAGVLHLEGEAPGVELGPGRKISLQQLLKFERKGHVVLRGLFSEREMAAVSPVVLAAADAGIVDAFRHRLALLDPGLDPATVRSERQAERLVKEHISEELEFLQVFNLHRKHAGARHVALSRRLACAAAELLGAKKVRLYQDCVFVKRGGYAATNWHSDLNMVPVDTNAFVTFWVPLRALAPDDSSLLFASGSHRDYSLAYWQSAEGMADLERRGYPLETYSDLKLGDATVHHGWTLHWAPGQPPGRRARAALSVSFFADGAAVLETRHARRKPHPEDAWSYDGWRRELREGQPARHPLLPLVFP